MNNDKLKYLDASGVQWELEDKILPAKTPTEQSLLSSDTQKKSTVVPAVAPVCDLDTKTVFADLKTLGDLLSFLSDFNHSLKQFAKNTVLPSLTGVPNRLLILTDMPSMDDENSGKILSGASGELLDKMLSAIGLSRESISISPLLFWRTPGGRSPTNDEMSFVDDYVSALISLLKPAAILTLGTCTAQKIANVKLPQDHGKITKFNDAIPIFPIFHPSYLLLKPDAKKQAWNALQELQKVLNSL